MKIDITKKQFEILINAVETSSFIYGPMSDMVNKKYKKVIKEIEEIEHYLLTFSSDFGFSDNIETFENGKKGTNEKYKDKILNNLSDYDDWQLFENLAHRLAWRDFKNTYSRVEINNLSKENNGYLGVEMYDFEKKYYDEFERHEYDRLFIKEK